MKLLKFEQKASSADHDTDPNLTAKFVTNKTGKPMPE